MNYQTNETDTTTRARITGRKKNIILFTSLYTLSTPNFFFKKESAISMIMMKNFQVFLLTSA